MQVSVSDSLSPLRDVYARQPDNPSVIVADGHGIRISVNRGHLIVNDGVNETRRFRKIPRVDAAMSNKGSAKSVRISRLVIIGTTGYVSLEALQWCMSLGVSVIQLDQAGRIVMSSPGQSGDARLRIQQVRAIGEPAGTIIMRDLMSDKLARQAAVLREVFSDFGAAEKLDQFAKVISVSDDPKEILALEGNGAGIYWRAWRNRGIYVPFAPNDLSLVPAHWHKFSGRTSLRNPLERGKNATSPANSLLNYAYAICETEVRYACHVLGLDPSIGYGHGFAEKSDSLVYDIMEPLRPEADRIVLAMLDTGNGPPYVNGKPAYIDPFWLSETADAVCRINAPLTHMLCERIPRAVARLAGIHAENVARILAGQMTRKLRLSRYIYETAPGRLDTHETKSVPSDLAVSEVIPDKAWQAIRHLIPPEPASNRPKPKPRADDRTCLAAIVLHETAGIPWKRMPVWGYSWATYARRFREFESADALAPILGILRPAHPVTDTGRQ